MDMEAGHLYSKKKFSCMIILACVHIVHVCMFDCSAVELVDACSEPHRQHALGTYLTQGWLRLAMVPNGTRCLCLFRPNTNCIEYGTLATVRHTIYVFMRLEN